MSAHEPLQRSSPRSLRLGPLAMRLDVLAAMAIVGVLALLCDAPAFFGGHPANSLIMPGGDVAEQVWFMGWLPHALTHGLNPFFSQYLFAGSGGVNLMVNTSVMFPALLLSPITMLFGPILAFNVAVVVTPAICAWPMMLLARRFTASFGLALAATVLWVMSPYVMSHLGFAHLHQTVTFFPPVVILLAASLVEGRRSPWRTGVLGALSVIAQFFTGSELLAMVAFEVALGLLVLAVVRPGFLVANWRRGAQALVAAGGISGVALAYPLWVEFFGPRHTTGSPWGAEYSIGNKLVGFVNSSVGFGHGDRLTSLMGKPGLPNAPLSFLGWGMILTVVATCIWLRRDRLVQVVAAVGALTFVLSLGVDVRVSGTTEVLFGWAPWRLFTKIPVVEQLIPGRLVQFVGFAAIILCLVGWEALRRQLAPRGRLVTAVALLSAVVVVGFQQVLVATVPFPSTVNFVEPSFFTTYGAHPTPNGRLLTVPYPDSGFGLQSAPMTYQARSGFTYELVGGYVLVPTTNGTQSAWLVPPTGGEGELHSFMSSIHVKKLTGDERRQIAAFINASKATDVVLIPIISDNALAEAEMTAIMGTQPRFNDGTVIWQHVNHVTPLPLSSEAIEGCATKTEGQFPQQTVACVLRAGGLKG